jgi:hypothetical protein
MTRSGATPGVPGPDDTETTESGIVSVFQEFDTTKSGRVPLSTLLHVLAEVDAPSALRVDEIQELLRMTGILNETTLRDPRTLYAMEVDYRAFVRHLMFAPPTSSTPAPPTSSGIGAGAADSAASSYLQRAPAVGSSVPLLGRPPAGGIAAGSRR